MLSNFLVEEYYERIRPEINLVGSFLEDPEISELLVKCRMKPYGYNTAFNRKLILRKHWVDDFGTSLFLEGKGVRILENNLEIDPVEIKHDDLYWGLSISKISKISKMLYLSLGEDEDFGENCAVLTFWGVDDCFRTFVLYNGEVRRHSTMSLGFSILKKILKNKDVQVSLPLKSVDRVIYPCSQWREWMIHLPIHETVWTDKNINKQLLNQLGVF